MAPQSTVTIVGVVFGCYEDPQVQVPQPRIPNFRFKGFMRVPRTGRIILLFRSNLGG